MNIKAKIERQFRERHFSRITRKTSKYGEAINRGYIVDYSDIFIIFQETEDFKLLGFSIFPIKSLKKIRYNNYDKYYDNIMDWEHQKQNLGIKTKVDLSNWKSIFETLRQKEINVIVECENPDVYAFTIGPVVKITDRSVHIRYFNAEGIFDKKPTKIKFKNISKVVFGDRYIDIFSKYLREPEEK